jgi:serine kinase of HPr protein (carbohydrate metabolism regulator)
VLVSDDRVQISCVGGRLTAGAPATIRGKLEVRGLGIMTVPCISSAELVLVAELAAPERIERFPDPQPVTDLMGVHLPLLYLAPFEAAAHVKLLLALVATVKRAPIVA